MAHLQTVQSEVWSAPALQGMSDADKLDLLAELALNFGKPVAHERLLEAVWGSPDADIRYLRVYIGQVREKIENDPQRPALLLSEPGYGYRLG